MIRVSSDRKGFSKGIGRNAAKAIFPAILQNQCNGGGEIGAALFNRMTLSVGAWDFGRPADIPFAILLNHCCELIPHAASIAPILHKNQPIIASGLSRSVRSVGTAASRVFV